jgi:hypothetical protein
MRDSEEPSDSLQLFIEENPPRDKDMISFADESDIRIPDEGQRCVVGLSSISYKYYKECNPVIKGKLSKARIMYDGALWENLDVAYGGKKSSPEMANALTDLMYRNLKKYNSPEDNCEIVAFVVCNAFSKYLPTIRERLSERLGSNIPPIITIGGKTIEEFVLEDEETGRGYYIQHMNPKSFKFKQIVGILSRIKHYNSLESHKK